MSMTNKHTRPPGQQAQLVRGQPNQPSLTAIYTRLSRDDMLEGESNSITTQKRMLEEYAAKNNFNNVRHFSDDGHSGTNFDRPAWKQLVAEVEAGNVSVVLAKDLSRVGRDYLQTGFYTEVFFREKGVRFITIANNIDSADSESAEFDRIKTTYQEERRKGKKEPRSIHG